ncbi:hypothetical protein HDV01_005612 [Terramyces sp. JEL0728]|nr:hypothetical protein HDV01_005612 [Terramyces sp. JEL0728]
MEVFLSQEKFMLELENKLDQVVNWGTRTKERLKIAVEEKTILLDVKKYLETECEKAVNETNRLTELLDRMANELDEHKKISFALKMQLESRSNSSDQSQANYYLSERLKECQNELLDERKENQTLIYTIKELKSKISAQERENIRLKEMQKESELENQLREMKIQQSVKLPITLDPNRTQNSLTEPPIIPERYNPQKLSDLGLGRKTSKENPGVETNTVPPSKEKLYDQANSGALALQQSNSTANSVGSNSPTKKSSLLHAPLNRKKSPSASKTLLKRVSNGQTEQSSFLQKEVVQSQTILNEFDQQIKGLADMKT